MFVNFVIIVWLWLWIHFYFQCFEFPDFFRVVLTVPQDKLKEACTRISDFCSKHYDAKPATNGDAANGHAPEWINELIEFCSWDKTCRYIIWWYSLSKLAQSVYLFFSALACRKREVILVNFKDGKNEVYCLQKPKKKLLEH